MARDRGLSTGDIYITYEKKRPSMSWLEMLGAIVMLISFLALGLMLLSLVAGALNITVPARALDLVVRTWVVTFVIGGFLLGLNRVAEWMREA